MVHVRCLQVVVNEEIVGEVQALQKFIHTLQAQLIQLQQVRSLPELDI